MVKTPKQSVFLFIGDDKYLKEKAIKELFSSFPEKSSSQSDHIVFYGGEVEARDVFDQLNTVPLFSERRFIIIKDMEDASDDLKRGLAEYSKNPSKSACLVMEARNSSVLKDFDAAAKGIAVRKLVRPEGSSFANWIREYLSSGGKTINADALAMLKELEGNELSYVSRELDKLVSFTGNRPGIGADDVDSVVGRSLAASVFKVGDHIGRRDSARAIRIVSDLVTGGRKEYEIMGILSWHFKRMLRAKKLIMKGESDYSVASVLAIGRKYQDDFFRQLAPFGLAQIKSGIETLLRADLDIKRSRLDPGTVLELAVIKLCLL